jgi:hypothetical protein
MKVAELEHCVAVLCGCSNGILKTHQSCGWLKKQCIQRAGATGLDVANQRVEGPSGDTGEIGI